MIARIMEILKRVNNETSLRQPNKTIISNTTFLKPSNTNGT